MQYCYSNNAAKVSASWENNGPKMSSKIPNILSRTSCPLPRRIWIYDAEGDEEGDPFPLHHFEILYRCGRNLAEKFIYLLCPRHGE